MGRENHGYGGLLHTTTPQNNALWVEMAGRNANDTGQPHRLYQRTLWRTRNHFFSQHTHVDRVLQRTRPGWWRKLDQVGPIVTVPVTVHHNSASASASAGARAGASVRGFYQKLVCKRHPCTDNRNLVSSTNKHEQIV